MNDELKLRRHAFIKAMTAGRFDKSMAEQVTPDLLRSADEPDDRTGVEGRTFAHEMAVYGHFDKIDPALITSDLLSLGTANGGMLTVAHEAARHGHLDQINPALITSELLQLRTGSGWTVAHDAADGGHLNQINSALVTPELLRLTKNWRGWTVAHSAAANGRLGQINPDLITPDLLQIPAEEYHTVGYYAAERPHQISSLLSRIPSLPVEIREAYRSALGTSIVKSATDQDEPTT